MSICEMVDLWEIRIKNKTEYIFTDDIESEVKRKFGIKVSRGNYENHGIRYIGREYKYTCDKCNVEMSDISPDSITIMIQCPICGKTEKYDLDPEH